MDEEYKCVICGCLLTEETAFFYEDNTKEKNRLPICSECLVTKTVLRKYLRKKDLPKLVKKFQRQKEKQTEKLMYKRIKEKKA